MAIIAGDLPPEDPGTSVNGDDWPPAGGGISWSWGFDLEALVDAVTGPAPWLRAAGADAAGAVGTDAAGVAGSDAAGADAAGVADSDHAGAACSPDPEAAAGAGLDARLEAEQEAYLEAVEAGVPELPVELVAGRVAENLPAGPGLAGWLALARAQDVEDGALAGVAASFRRLASWAAAGELAAVAQIASRSARADRRASVDPAGRPDRVTGDAAGQVSLALAMSHDGASAWADLGVTLAWRLRATGAALEAGEIDVARARMIARVTGPLSDAAARQVEATVLGRAGWQTLGQLHAALRAAVIRADPDGAERRRRDAERKAQVVLYPEDEGTATLAGYALPGVAASAAMARITALAKAMQAAGNGGRTDLVRAQVFLGLLLGTLPYIPPAPGAPDDPPPDDPPRGSPREDPPAGDDCPAGPSAPHDTAPHDPAPEDPAPEDPAPEDPAPEDPAPGPNGPDAWPDDLGSAAGPAWPWPGVLPFLREAPAGLNGRAPPVTGGLLNLTVPLGTLIGASSAPGKLTRLGVITPEQARELAALAARHLATLWAIIITNPEGQAIAVTRLPRSRSPAIVADGIGLIGRVTLVVRTDQLAFGALGASAALAEKSATLLPAGSSLAKIVDRALVAARREAATAEERRKDDELAGGCAHGLASPAYRPPPRIAALVVARDGTCRFGTCRRPAEKCDLDHVVPFDQGGLTCMCNLGGDCRLHHQIKQNRGWSVTQTVPGVFRWTTPAGRTYVVRPDPLIT